MDKYKKYVYIKGMISAFAKLSSYNTFFETLQSVNNTDDVRFVLQLKMADLQPPSTESPFLVLFLYLHYNT